MTRLIMFTNLEETRCIERVSDDLADLLVKQGTAVPATREEARCEQHPAYYATYCPMCDTAVVIPKAAR